LSPEVQLPNRFSHGLHRRGADRWIVSAEQYLIPAMLQPTRSKAESEEVRTLLQRTQTLTSYVPPPVHCRTSKGHCTLLTPSQY
jgi:hypothetical protein